MSRLADYFFILGVDDKSDLYNGKELKGTLVQKFPDQDWKEEPAPQGLEVFCQPTGWCASSEPRECTFQVLILTDVEGKPSYLACLCFYECVTQKVETNSLNIEFREDAKLADVEKAIKSSDSVVEELFYIPKCLCVVSRHHYYTTLKNCLLTIFSAYLNGETELVEKMIGCMIGFVHVPPPGGPKLTFSIGGSDSQVIHPPLYADIPSTQESVAIIFNQLGIHSMLRVFAALLTECKILLLSSSFTHLTMAAEALVALLYPLTFNYVFIPILPSSLLDFLTAPTPFLMGVHTSYADQLPELFDVVCVNIDEGYVTVPDAVNLSDISEPFYTQILNTLKMILTPSLFTSDLLFPIADAAPSLALQDKQLRAVFIKLFAEISCGYRACLTLIRVHPQPVISFNKLAFMEKRGFVGDEFISKVLDSVGFSTMTQQRGPPYRVIDMFDKLVVEFLPSEKKKDVQELLNDLIFIVDELLNNEQSLEAPDQNVIPKINRDMINKPLKTFPLLSETKINAYITKNENTTTAKVFHAPPQVPYQVPMSTYDKPVTHYINQRRLEVIKDCVQYIYENKISEARKAIPSVLRALKSKGAQLALCNELEHRVKNDNSLLEHDQYNLLVRLINAALQDDNTVNSTNVAAKIVPLVAAFHRKLGPSVIQFAYTSVQEHSVWSNVHFWEEAFYNEAQKKIVELYTNERRKKEKQQQQQQPQTESDLKVRADSTPTEKVSNNAGVPSDESVLNNVKADPAAPGSASNSPVVKRTVSETDAEKLPSHPKSDSLLAPPASPLQRNRTSTTQSSSSTLVDETEMTVPKNTIKDLPDAMKLAADLLGEWGDKSEEEKGCLIYEEESIIYSLTMLFAQHMMYLRVPTNACAEMRKIQHLKNLQHERRMQQLAVLDGQNDDTVSLRPTPSIADAASTYMGGSVMESSSTGSTYDLDVGFGESVKDSTSKFILRFVERVCIEAGVTAQHLRSLTQNIPMLVGMHIESLEEVYRETKDAPTHKAKIMKPTLLPGEKLQFDGLRCFLIPDGRELGIRTDLNIIRTPVSGSVNETFDDERELNIGATNGGPCLLPAEGALFLTNYRVIFKGSPLDQFASEMTVTRSFPIGGLVKEKKINGDIFVYPGQICDSYLQLRSSTLQLMKLAFDEEVMSETIDNFRKSLVRSRWPPSVYNTFAFNYKAPPVLQRTLSQRQQSIKKTHKNLNSVTQLKRLTAANRAKQQRTAVAEDSTTRKYEAVSKDNSFTSDSDDDMQQVVIEQQNRGADRLRESPICKDYERLGLGGITKISSSPWRLAMANFHYNVCRSYPAIVVVPCHISDDTIMKVAKNHRLSRFPVAIWRHRRTKGTLLRSGAISNKSVLTAVLRTGLTGGQAQSNHQTSDDERFYSEIVNATHLYTHKGQAQTVSSGAALSMQAMSDDFATMFEGSEAFNKSADEMNEIQSWEPAHLYIFTRGTAKIQKIESSQRVVVVNVELHDVAQVKTSFSKLVKVCCPSSANNENKFLSNLEDSKWLNQVSLLLQISCSIASLMDIQGSSCLVALGDGSEVTSQVVSLVQILSDPYYRTIAGFKVLIEKDWLAYGYRFSHRGNHTTPVQTAIAPFFLQFLDCVHQILHQYPHAFEFNNYFIKLIAYHQTSMRFNTFFLDSEHERYHHGWFPDSEQSHEPSKPNTDGSLRKAAGMVRNKKDANLRAEQLAQQQLEQKKKKSTSVSLWDYLDSQAKKFTLFQSFAYHSQLHKTILLPFCNISNLEIWDFLTAENLYTGPTYDVELISDFEIANPAGNETSITAATPTDVDREDSQRCMTGCYGNTQEFPRDEITYLLSELSRLNEEMDQSSKRWKSTFEELSVKNVLKKQYKSMNWQVYWAKERRSALHKRATIDIVMKGKVTESGQIRTEFGFEHPHNFISKNYIKSSICNYCLQSIAGFNAGLHCAQCGYNVHEKCQSMVPAECPKHQSLIDQPATELSRSSHSLQGTESRNPGNYKGTLYKRGHLLRQWKARWFVLDAERNHLTYYDSEEDTQLQGYIDLGELRACRLVNFPPGAPKWGNPRAFFELETTKRIYYLLAPNNETAKEWVERLNALNV